MNQTQASVEWRNIFEVYAVVLIAVLLGSSWGYAAGNSNTPTADAALAEAARYSSFGTEAFDRETAVSILERFLEANKHELSALDEVKVCLELGTLYSYRVPPTLRDGNLSLHWLRRAVLAAPDKMTLQLAIARANLVSSLANGSQKTTETIREIRWRQWLLLRGTPHWAVSWENISAQGYRAGISRDLAKALSEDATMHESVVRSAASRGALDELRLLIREFQPGAQAYKELARNYISALRPGDRGAPEGATQEQWVVDVGEAEGALAAVLVKARELSEGTTGISRARSLLGEYLDIKRDEMVPSQRQRVLLELARMYGLLAPEAEKDNVRASDFYRQVLSIPDSLSVAAIAARVELPMVLADRSEGIEEAMREHLWVSTKLDAPVLLIEKLLTSAPGARPCAGYELSARIVATKAKLAKAQAMLCECMVSLAQMSDDPSAALSAIAERYLAGAMACQAIIERNASGWDGAVETPPELQGRIGFLEGLRTQEYDASVVRGLLEDMKMRVMVSVENGLEVLQCDLVLAAVEEYVYGIREYEKSLYVMSRDERDRLIDAWPARWSEDQAGYGAAVPQDGIALTDRMKICMVEAALRRLREGTEVERYCSVLRKFLCTDFAYELRVKYLKEEPSTVSAEIEIAWRKIAELAPEKWKEALSDHVETASQLERDQWDAITREVARKRVELMRNPVVTGRAFLDSVWPKWKQSDTGRRQTWLWLRGSTTRFRGVPVSRELQKIYEGLDTENLGDLVDANTPIYLQILRR